MDDNKAVNVEEKTGSGFNLLEFFRETRREIAKVTWPSRKETLVTTAMIVVMALIVGLFYFAIDSVIGFAVSKILGMGG